MSPSRSHYYDRDGKPIDTGSHMTDTIVWGRLREDESYMRIGHYVGVGKVKGVTVTTIWHGINVTLGSDPPEIFETMIFGGRFDLKGARYATKDEAAQGHQRAVEDIKAGRTPWFMKDSDA